MIIAQISDTHIMANAADNAVGERRAESLRRCIADINRQRVEAVVHTGDGVHNGLTAEYAHLREILAGLEAPLYLVPGNRDRTSVLRSAFDDFAYLPRTGDFLHYAIERHPIRLVALDSVSAGERKGVFCERRLAWLDETLSREPGRPTILFMHHPPFDIADRDYVGGYRRAQDAADLAAVVSRHKQVMRLLCGHVHCLHRESWAGTIATTMPSVAIDLRKENDSAFAAATLYTLHIASDGGDLVTRVQVVAH